MRTKKFTIIVAFLCALILGACGQTVSYPARIHALCGLDIAGSALISSKDTHDGFHGDGATVVQYDCTPIADAVLRKSESWAVLPMTENLHKIMYEDGYSLAAKYGIPTVSHGRYFFVDSQAEADTHSDANLLARPSFNFTLVILDTDSNQLYFFKYDT